MKSNSLQKYLALLLALGMLISSLPITANAQAPITQDGNILESAPQAGTGEYLNLGEPLPADYQLNDEEINLILDDGYAEQSIGSSAGTVNILALNRFSPGIQFPFTLTEIRFLSDYREISAIAPGQPIRLVVFQNTNGDSVSDPSNGAELVLEVSETVQVATGWNVYELDQPLLLEGPGDVLIGVLFEYQPYTPYFPAVYDETTITQRSWVGLWNGAAPTPLTIPATGQWGEIGAMGFPGTFTVRGKGVPAGEYRLTGTVTNTTTSAPLANAAVTATLPTGSPRTAITDANGNYRLALDAGTYSITAAKLGYEPKTETVTITEGHVGPFVQDFALLQRPTTVLWHSQGRWYQRHISQTWLSPLCQNLPHRHGRNRGYLFGPIYW